MTALSDSPTFDTWSEAHIIGAAMTCAWLDAERLPELLAAADPEDFFDPVHGRIWAKARELAGGGTLLTARALADAMGRDGGFNDWGGFDRLFDLWNHGALYGTAEMAGSIRDRALRRRMIQAGEDLRHAAHDVAVPAFDHLAQAERELGLMLAASAPSERCLVDARTAALAAAEEMAAEAEDGRPRGLMCGLDCFDGRLGGFRPGWLVVLAGRPSMGKTALARSAAMAAAMRNPDRTVVFFALEMDRRELSDRTLSELSHLDDPLSAIPYKDMRGEALSAASLARLARLAQGVPANLVIDDSPVLSVDYVRRRLHGLKRQGRLGLVVIDYLQIMQRPKADGRTEAGVIGEMTQGLKQIARELGVCILLLSQLNRAVEHRENKRPQLADLRDSGAIEQDANAVLFCYRDLYYLERARPSDRAQLAGWQADCEAARTRMDVLAMKVRGGQIGEDAVRYLAWVDHVESGEAGHG